MSRREGKRKAPPPPPSSDDQPSQSTEQEKSDENQVLETKKRRRAPPPPPEPTPSTSAPSPAPPSATTVAPKTKTPSKEKETNISAQKPSSKPQPPQSKIAFSALTASLLSAGSVKPSLQLQSGLITNKVNPLEKAQESSSLYDGHTLNAPALKQKREQRIKTVGKGWFDMVPMKVDENLKRDIQMIQMRNVLDPKRFYKNPDKIKNPLHIGTIVEGPSEFYSARLTKKERKQSLVEEILADKNIQSYSKRKYLDIQSTKSNYVKAYNDKHGNRRPKKTKGGRF